MDFKSANVVSLYEMRFDNKGVSYKPISLI